MIQCLFFGGRHVDGCWGKGVWVMWHLSVLRKTANSRTRDARNPMPWSGCVNLQYLNQKHEKIWSGRLGSARRGMYCQRAVPWAGAAHQSWGGVDHSVSRLGDGAMQIRENPENIMRFWEEMTQLYLFQTTLREGPALPFAPQLTEGWAPQNTVKPCRHWFGENKWHQLHFRETEIEQLCPWQGPGEVGTGWSLRSLSTQTILWLWLCELTGSAVATLSNRIIQSYDLKPFSPCCGC